MAADDVPVTRRECGEKHSKLFERLDRIERTQDRQADCTERIGDDVQATRTDVRDVKELIRDVAQTNAQTAQVQLSIALDRKFYQKLLYQLVGGVLTICAALLGLKAWGFI